VAKTATIETSKGTIVADLYDTEAPDTVANFEKLANSEFYDGTRFHRVINNFMIQGGGFKADYSPKETRGPIRNEASNGLSNKRGTVAMARTGDPSSATAQFFINLVDNRRLDYAGNQSGLTWGYAVFGKVVEGIDVVDRIAKLPTRAQGPFAADVPNPLPVIESARVIGEEAPASAASTTPPAKATQPAGRKDG
jgi:cyclophilin family peptidyl-prolyl cis-trans isomerase